MENLLRTGFERRILQKMATGYFNIHCKEKCIFENLLQKVHTELNVIFNFITDISFLNYVTKIFCICYYFQEIFWECFKVQRSVSVSVYILSSKGANQLQELCIRTLGNKERNFFT